MYLSCLWVNVGSDPDHPRPGRLWLRNMYHVHQRLSMAFPTAARKKDDPPFLKPFAPDGSQHVHGPRTEAQAFLFRVDPLPGGRAAILVQSGARPDWEYAFYNAGYLLAGPPEVRPYDPRFAANQRLRFRLLANPVRKVSPRSLDSWGNPFDARWIGKDVPVPAVELHRWLERRAEENRARPGFRLVEVFPPQGGYLFWRKGKEEGPGRRLRSARYEGILEVIDPAHFHNTLVRGIGPAKAFGCGLLSVAPLGR
ncbi:MAG: type I-E CRISPR-associated protein Cas6/Cse3/CasE [Chloroflexi bacterium]|nr:type I-E CRISPR-associated protein Cas6/Cse3/CasE [Chloroflexota bacterium]